MSVMLPACIAASSTVGASPKQLADCCRHRTQRGQPAHCTCCLAPRTRLTPFHTRLATTVLMANMSLSAGTLCVDSIVIPCSMSLAALEGCD